MFSSSIQLRQLLVLCLGIGLGTVVTFIAVKSPKPPTTPMASTAAAKPQVLYWYEPMEPAQHFDKPG